MRKLRFRDRYSPLELIYHLESNGDFRRLKSVLTELFNTFSCFHLHYQQNWSVKMIPKTVGASKYSVVDR